MKIIAAHDILCPVCRSGPGEQCTFMYGQGQRRQRKFRYGSHSKRVRDAELAMKTLDALVNS